MKTKSLNFWKSKRVLITGHTGFKGSWLVLMLSYLGAEVYGVSREKKDGIYEKANVSGICSKEYFTDISSKNYKDLEEIVNAIKPEVIFHFAAQSLVIKSYEDPADTIHTNIIGTYNVMEVSNNCKELKSLVVATTDKVYKNPSEDNTEASELGGKDFYSASKVSCEMIIQAFIKASKRKDLAISIVRSGNVIGGGDRAENRLMTDLVTSLLQNSEFNLRMPNSIRPWQYILDSLYGYLLVAEKGLENNESEVFNLNSDKNNKFNAEDISKMMFRKWDAPLSNIKLENNKKEHEEVKTLKINSSKAKLKLNWEPKYNLEKIVSEIVEWEKNYSVNTGPSFSILQIEKYLEL